MKVIFLDVDGVLNNRKAFREAREKDICGVTVLDPECVERMEMLQKQTEAKVVLSSTWRKFEHLSSHLKENSSLDFHEDWRTLDMSTQRMSASLLKGVARGWEIQEWLQRHPEVTHYVIVDDDSDMLKTQMQHFVKTEADLGFTDRHLAMCLSILKNQPRDL